MSVDHLTANSPVSVANLVGKLDTTAPIIDAKKMEFAKQFESVLMHRVLEQMKESVGQWGFEVDGAAAQTYDLFWFHLADELGRQGGLGLWKQIYQSLQADGVAAPGKPLDQGQGV
ncbi:MAG TPA: hypothetical protein ENN81_12055 [Phycisphaerales bacterium]|nr:hypothetical protein [Phycisphaerales bacterium]